MVDLINKRMPWRERAKRTGATLCFSRWNKGWPLSIASQSRYPDKPRGNCSSPEEAIPHSLTRDGAKREIVTTSLPSNRTAPGYKLHSPWRLDSVSRIPCRPRLSCFCNCYCRLDIHFQSGFLSPATAAPVTGPLVGEKSRLSPVIHRIHSYPQQIAVEARLSLRYSRRVEFNCFARTADAPGRRSGILVAVFARLPVLRRSRS